MHGNLISSKLGGVVLSFVELRGATFSLYKIQRYCCIEVSSEDHQTELKQHGYITHTITLLPASPKASRLATASTLWQDMNTWTSQCLKNRRSGGRLASLFPAATKRVHACHARVASLSCSGVPGSKHHGTGRSRSAERLGRRWTPEPSRRTRAKPSMAALSS